MIAPVCVVSVTEAGAGALFRDELGKAVRRAQDERAAVIVDLRAVSELGYLSALALLRADDLIAAADSQMVVIVPGPKTLAVLRRSGVGDSLQVCHTLQAARRLLRGVRA